MNAANPILKISDPVEPRAHEPSMEEILLSIRRIIADDQALLAGRDGEAARVAEPQRPAPGASKAEPGEAARTPDLVLALPDDENAEPELSAASSPPQADAEPRLLSAAADKSVAAAFNLLIASRFARNSEAIASLTRDMLRPMLKAWLDENLPALVERLVRAEIERLARQD
ncbi:PopZ family protein [Methylocapsa acidiphila]|uniref:PopZ family protein n=1 Tax=Methylocapsa acidiphila TaxID=133552 RepID=UPI001FD92699|nr:DUF2497 domain-containing protein [Methylocapsa acidiphila]